MPLPPRPAGPQLPPGMTLEDLVQLLLQLSQKGGASPASPTGPPSPPSRPMTGVAAFTPQDWARQALQRRAALMALQQLQGQRR